MKRDVGVGSTSINAKKSGYPFKHNSRTRKKVWPPCLNVLYRCILALDCSDFWLLKCPTTSVTWFLSIMSCHANCVKQIFSYFIQTWLSRQPGSKLCNVETI